MDEIDILEERISSIEEKVFGKRNPHDFEYKTSVPVSQSLIDISVMLSSALSGRETITSTLNRLPELNEYLDPNYEDSLIDTDAKMEYVLAMESDIKELANQVQTMSKLLPVLDSEALKNLPIPSKKLNELALSYLEIKEESDEVTKNIHEAMRKYNDIIHAIAKNFSQLEAAVTEMELARQQAKKVQD